MSDEYTSGNDELDDILNQAAAQAELEEDDVELDLSEAGSYDPFTGEHPAIFTKVELVRAKKTGDTQLKCEVTVTGGEHTGRKAWPYLMLKGKGTWKTKAAILALGLDVDLDAHPVKLGKISRFKDTPFLGVFEVEPAKGDYAAKTVLTGFKALEVDVPDDVV